MVEVEGRASYKIIVNVGGKTKEISGSTPEQLLNRLAEEMAALGGRVLVIDANSGNIIDSPTTLIEMLRSQGTVRIQLVRRAQAGQA